MMKLHLPLFIAFFIFQSIQAQTLNDRAMEQAKKSFSQFYELLSLENDAHFPKAIEQNMLWCEKAFSTRQFTTRRLQTNGIPLLLAERSFKGAKKTVLIYLQIDGQPVDPEKWDQ
jgi:hypothetical protein